MNAQIEQVLSTIQSMDERSQMEVALRILTDLAAHSFNNKLWLAEAEHRLEKYEPGSGIESESLFLKLQTLLRSVNVQLSLDEVDRRIAAHDPSTDVDAEVMLKKARNSIAERMKSDAK